MRYELADAHLAWALAELLDVVLAVEPTVACVDDDAVVSRQGGDA